MTADICRQRAFRRISAFRCCTASAFFALAYASARRTGQGSISADISTPHGSRARWSANNSAPGGRWNGSHWQALSLREELPRQRPESWIIAGEDENEAIRTPEADVRSMSPTSLLSPQLGSTRLPHGRSRARARTGGAQACGVGTIRSLHKPGICSRHCSRSMGTCRPCRCIGLRRPCRRRSRRGGWRGLIRDAAGGRSCTTLSAPK